MRTAQNWTQCQAPGIKTTCPVPVMREAKVALADVDRDVELTGAISADTVDKVRAALALIRST